MIYDFHAQCARTRDISDTDGNLYSTPTERLANTLCNSRSRHQSNRPTSCRKVCGQSGIKYGPIDQISIFLSSVIAPTPAPCMRYVKRQYQTCPSPVLHVVGHKCQIHAAPCGVTLSTGAIYAFRDISFRIASLFMSYRLL